MTSLRAFSVFWTILLLTCTSGFASGTVIRVMTFNIRLNVESDSLNAWPHRKDMTASMIRFHKADIVGLQEALMGQVEDLAQRLPEYAWFGVGRDDGRKSGEIMAIFYLRDRFSVRDQSTFWLSENPQEPGIGWDAACNRTVTWCKFQDILSNKIFFFFNTHFDHKGRIARRESAHLLIKFINDIAGNSDVIVTGDFNATPDSEVYTILTEKPPERSTPLLIDAKSVSRFPHHGPSRTFTAFQIPKLLEVGHPIDYIFVTDGISVISHGTLSDTFDGFLPSDHLPVLAEIFIE